MIKQTTLTNSKSVSRSTNFRVAGILLSLAVTALVGCDDRLTRAVGGHVTLDGQPLKTGMIQFSPVRGTTGPVAGASIEDGKFIVQDVAQGLRADGAYRVSIVSRVPSGQMVANPNSPTGESEYLKNIIPDRYNIKTELEVTISADEENEFLFELTSDH